MTSPCYTSSVMDSITVPPTTSTMLMRNVTETKRKSRNMSEKKRRDAFNRLIGELAVYVANNERKLDKSNVLKQTISFLRAQKHREHPQPPSMTISPSTTPDDDRDKPVCLTHDQFLHASLDVFGGCVMVIGANGLCMWASRSLLSYVDAHTFGDGRCIPLDRVFSCASVEMLQRALSNEMLRAAAGNGSPLARTDSYHSFSVTLRTDHDVPPLSLCLVGKFQRLPFTEQEVATATCVAAQCTRCVFAEVPDRRMLCLVATGRVDPVPLGDVSSTALLTPIRTLPDYDDDDDAFTLVLNAEGVILGADKSVVYVLGFSPNELCGHSVYELCASDELINNAAAMRDASTFSLPSRLRCKDGRMLSVQSNITDLVGVPPARRFVCRCRAAIFGSLRVSGPSTTISSLCKTNTASPKPLTTVSKMSDRCSTSQASPSADCVFATVTPSPCGSTCSSVSSMQSNVKTSSRQQPSPQIRRSSNVWIESAPLNLSSSNATSSANSPKTVGANLSLSRSAPLLNASTRTSSTAADASQLNDEERKILFSLQNTAFALQQQVISQQRELMLLLSTSSSDTGAPPASSTQQMHAAPTFTTLQPAAVCVSSTPSVSTNVSVTTTLLPRL